MRNKEVSESAFFWMLQGICALHRKPFSLELAQQQLAAPHTPESFLRAAEAYGFDASTRKAKPDKLQKENFPLIVWLHPKPAAPPAEGAQVTISIAPPIELQNEQPPPSETFISADSSEINKANETASNQSSNGNTSTQNTMTYKARIKLDAQTLTDPQGNKLQFSPGMQVVAEINQGKRSVLEYLLSPVQKAVQEAGRER